MSSAIPLAWFLLTGAVWLAAAIQSHRLLWRFTSTFPADADEQIPYARSHMRHPEKLLFFLRPTSVPLLQRDAAIWRMRQQFVALTYLSLTLPVAGFVIIAAVALALCP
jgi:hypothetical protein